MGAERVALPVLRNVFNDPNADPKQREEARRILLRYVERLAEQSGRQRVTVTLRLIALEGHPPPSRPHGHSVTRALPP